MGNWAPTTIRVTHLRSPLVITRGVGADDLDNSALLISLAKQKAEIKYSEIVPGAPSKLAPISRKRPAPGNTKLIWLLPVLLSLTPAGSRTSHLVDGFDIHIAQFCSMIRLGRGPCPRCRSPSIF